MVPSRKDVTQATAATPTTPKGKGKAIEAHEFADRQPNPSNIHNSSAEDSHSNFASPRQTQVAEPEPQYNSEQLLQMLSNMQKQMEDQQMKMIWLRETTALEKEAATRIQTQLLKQVGTLRKSQSSRSVEGRTRASLSPQHGGESAHILPVTQNATGRRFATMNAPRTQGVSKP